MKAISGRLGARKVAVIGAGVIGLSIAWRLAQRNIDVCVFEASVPGRGASHAAAGMLSVVAEAEPSGRAFFELCRASRRMWPRFARELSVASAIDLDLREHGTLLVAQSSHEAAALEALAEAYRADGTLWRIEPDEWHVREPNLAADARAVYFAPEDGQVDNRATVTALARAAASLGVDIRTHEPALRLIASNDEVRGVETARGRSEFDLVVVASGIGTDALMRASGLALAMPGVIPVKGQTIALQMDPAAPLLHHVVRGETHYLVPRSSGLLIIGATSEPGNSDPTVTSEATELLVDGARSLVPALAELPVVEAWAGLRPLAQNGLPVVGESMPGLVLALGHYRNGVLLAPVTAEIVAATATATPLPELSAVARPFAPHAEHRAALTNNS